MTTMACALVVDRDAVPAVADVVKRLAEHGHAITFPRGFEFTDGDHELWLPVTLDGTRTGFDYGIVPVDSLAGEDPEAAASLGDIGSHVLDFGARGQESVRAATIVLRAICELSGASGWVEGEVVPAGDMPRFLTGVAESAEGLAARLAALPQPTKAQQKAAFKAFMDSRPKAPSPRRFTIAMWIVLWVGAGLIGWFLATS